MKKLAIILALALALCLTTSALAETVFQERVSSALILDQIVSDLEMAEMYAQPISNNTFSRSRVNIMSIYAMMADVYAWMHEYEKVIEFVEKINSLSKSKPYWKMLTLSSGASQTTFSSQWRAIFKSNNWDLGSGEYTVYCTNGTITT